VRVAAADQRVTVTDLTEEEARLLETEPGRPAFRIERTTRDADGTVIEFASSVYRGDRYEVLMHARRDPQG
jgi:GntR family transcriptional regulator